MIKRNKLLILVGIILAIIILVLAFTIISSAGSDDEFNKNLENAYSSYTNLSSKIEKYNHDQQSTDYFKKSNVKKELKTLEDIKKTNNKTKDYLKLSLKSANDDVEKKYLNLLINQTDLIDDSIDIDIRALKFKENFLNGKIGVTTHNNEMEKIIKNDNNTFKKVDKNSQAISDLLAENLDFEKRLNNLDIGMEFTGGSFINSLFLRYS